ncbi:hypothetical protein AOLI_G00089440 [Acnodon oligacanthus]
MWRRRSGETLTDENFFVITPDGKTENVNGLGDRTEFTGNIQEDIGSILLKNVTVLDQGIYTCTFNTLPSGTYEKQISLIVLVPPVVGVTTDVIPVAGQSKVILATCTATKARPAADVSWRLGALSDSVKVQTNISADPGGTYTVKSYLIGVAFKDLNQQKVQCLVNHTSLNEVLILDYALIIHYPPQSVEIISVAVSETTKEFQCELMPVHNQRHSLGAASNQYGSGMDTLSMQVFRECTTEIDHMYFMTERAWHSEHNPVTTDSARPTSNGRQNLQDSSELMHHTLIHQAYCH